MKNNAPSLPPSITPGASGDLTQFLGRQQVEVEQAFSTSGAVLFRGFDVPNPAAFDRAVAAMPGQNFAYAESLSNAVRVNVTERVFTANEAPPETEIFLHHEMAQTPIYPSRLAFYCDIAPGEGGATPLCRSDLLMERLEEDLPELAQAFTRKGVRYTHTMPGADDAGSGQGRSWRSTLGTETREAAEARLGQLAYAFEWQDDGSLRVTTPRLDAVRDLGGGRRSFFNQLIAAYRGWSDSRNDARRSISYGDGSGIDPAAMMRAIEMAEELTYDHAWQAGDVVLVDNFVTMHGRRPYAGKRRVLASLFA
mgnify:CR=1 FL=1